MDSGVIKEVLKSDMVMLDNDKRYRLDNILVPPYEESTAVDELNHEFLNKNVTIYTYHGAADLFDRYGVPLAHVVTDKDVWVQEDLILKGLAWAFSADTDSEIVDILKKMEEKARSHKLGFWKNPAYAVKTPDNVKDYINSYQIVEGKITDVLEKNDVVFFSFSKDGKTDFAVKVMIRFQTFAKSRRGFAAKFSTPAGWKDATIRVRGWVVGKNVPVIELTNQEQIDILSPGGK